MITGSVLKRQWVQHCACYLIHCPLFFQFRLVGAGAGTGAAAGFIWWAGLAAGLQEGQALSCSSYLGLG